MGYWQRCYSLSQFQKNIFHLERFLSFKQLTAAHARAHLLNILLLHYYCILLIIIVVTVITATLPDACTRAAVRPSGGT